MRAGKLDARIVILEPHVAPGKTGAPRTTYTKKIVLPAAIIFEEGREGFNASQVAPEYDARFQIRYRADIKRTQVIRYAGQDYDIFSLVPFPRKGRLEIRAKCRLADMPIEVVPLALEGPLP